MGILNVTPDSFSDGGVYLDHDSALRRGVEMAEQGADIIDVGGESTRPGSDRVPAEQEAERVVPVIRRLAAEVGIPISIDTMKSEVAERALEAGAAIVNDVSALRFDPKMLDVVAGTSCGLVTMHMLGEPKTMQENPTYSDVVAEVRDFLEEVADRAVAAGVDSSRIAVDPGIGFGKTADDNLSLLASLGTEAWPTSSGFPVVVGPSRKNFIGVTLDLPVEDRLEGTAAVVAWLASRRAHVVRVHDVKEMSRIVRMIQAVQAHEPLRIAGRTGG